MGGWTSDRAPELLGRYAGYMAKALGDSVPFWLTINEPPVLPAASYIMAVHPPAKRDWTLAMTAMRNILKSLGTMHHAIRENAPHNPQIGPVINMTYAMPATDSEEDKAAAAAMDQYWNRFWLDGLRDGIIGAPAGSGEEVPGLKGCWDFVGLNYYSRSLVAATGRGMNMRQMPPPPGSECSTMGWQVYPEGFYQCMMQLKPYGKAVYITENGIGTDDDEQRISYIVRHLYEVQRAMKDGVDVRSYLHWCQQDNFEWAEGYRQKFGLFGTEEGTLNRIPKPSAYFFKEVAQKNALPGELIEKYVKDA
jgi:beta-glucosidase